MRIKKMKAAIVIGTYNNEDYIVETIKSVKSQTYEYWEALVIDNGSTDQTSAIAIKEISGDPRFKFIQKDNEGPSVFRNLGYQKIGVSSDYIHFLDGDDLLCPNFMSIMCEYLNKNLKVGVVACQFDVINHNGDFVSHGFRSRYAQGFLGFPRQLGSKEFKTPFECFFAATGQGLFAVFRSEIFAQTKGYEPTFWSYEDSDIFCQMALISEVHYLPCRLYKKRSHVRNLTHSSAADYGKFRKKWDVYKSNDPRINVRIKNALKYYFGYHATLRNFKLAFKDPLEFCKGGNLNNFLWA